MTDEVDLPKAPEDSEDFYKCHALRQCGRGSRCNVEAVSRWSVMQKMLKDEGDVQTMSLSLCQEHDKIFRRRLHSKRICHTALRPIYPMGILDPEPYFRMNMVMPVIPKWMEAQYETFALQSYVSVGMATVQNEAA